MNALDRFLAACRPADAVSEWLREYKIWMDQIEDRGCRWVGREFLEAISKSDRAAFGKGIDILEKWCSPEIGVGSLLVPYKRFGETIGIKAIPSRDMIPPAINLTPMPWPLWIDDLTIPDVDVVVGWGEMESLHLRSHRDGDDIVIGLPGFWKKMWAPLFEGRSVHLCVPGEQRDKIKPDMLANGAKIVS
jgi:hypothetical protein